MPARTILFSMSGVFNKKPVAIDGPAYGRSAFRANKQNSSILGRYNPNIGMAVVGLNPEVRLGVHQ